MVLRVSIQRVSGTFQEVLGDTSRSQGCFTGVPEVSRVNESFEGNIVGVSGDIRGF